MKFDFLTIELADGRTVRGYHYGGRLDRDDVPAGFHKYDLREADVDCGDIASISDYVLVNHFGTFITEEDLNLTEEIAVNYWNWDPYVDLNISVGDRVIYRPDWGHGSPKVAIVTAIELCKAHREKYGKTVRTIPSEKIEYGNFTFDNGNWAYGDHILCKCQFPIVKETSLKERLEEKLDVLPTCMDYKSLLDHVRSLTNLKDNEIRDIYGPWTYRKWAAYFGL